MRITWRFGKLVTYTGVGLLAVGWGCSNHAGGEERVSPADRNVEQAKGSEEVPDKIIRSDEEWRRILTADQYRVTRECGTEPPFTGKYYDLKDKGTYLCVACGNELFSSDTKFDSGSGWPSFWAPVSEKGISERADRRLGMVRMEVRCGRCDAHLGHVFEDGPRPTGLRYCINSAALNFAAKEDSSGK